MIYQAGPIRPLCGHFPSENYPHKIGSGPFSLAHGGKDRHPFPVPTLVYDRTIAVMKSAVRKAKLGNAEELAALQRLDDQARRLERTTTGPSLSALIAEERVRSHEYGGRSVFGWEPPSRSAVRRS
jgi:hypothetical protein